MYMTPEREEHREIDAEGLSAVEVATFNGPLLVECGADAPHLVASVWGKASYEVERIGSLLYIRAHKKGLTYASGGVGMALWLPVGLRCKLANVGGNIRLHGATARADISIVNGGVDVAESGRGEVRVSSGDAPVRMRDAAGRIAIHLGHGEVDLAQMRGEIEIKSGFGPIAIADATGQIQINIGHSDMRLERITFAPGTHNWIRNGGGAITIAGMQAPEGLQLHAKGARVTFPDAAPGYAIQKARHELHARLAGERPAHFEITTGGPVTFE
jgi:hypothetical protein